jgi:hypothetical protein
MYLAHPSFELPCGHSFQRADIAFNLISNLIFGDFQVIARLEIHPERRTIVEVAGETQGCVCSNCPFLAVLLLIPKTAGLGAGLTVVWMTAVILSHIFVLGYGWFFVDALMVMLLAVIYLLLTRRQSRWG